MRLVQVMIPAGEKEAILEVLDDEEIDYVLTDETSGREYTHIVSFPLPVAAVEPVLGHLREAGVERDAYTVVLDAETVISQRFERLTERYEETEDNDGNRGRIAREELVARAEDLAPEFPTFAILTAISAIVATAGLLIDSPAVVVGSMVIAPLIGPAMATSVGSVLDENDMFVRGVRLQVIGAILAVASAALFAATLKWFGAIPLSANEVFAIGEVRERLAPGILSLPVALGAGIAGALSLSSGVSTALVGVMIAAALVPPVAVVGIGLAWGHPGTVLGAGLLVLVNFLSVNLSALAVLQYQGYQPFHWFRQGDATRTTAKRIAVIGVILLVLSGLLGGVTFIGYQTAQFEDETRKTAQRITTEGPRGDVQYLSMHITYGDYPIRQPQSVTITYGHSSEKSPPSLADTLTRRINRQYQPIFDFGTDAHIEVTVRYIAIERSSE